MNLYFRFIILTCIVAFMLTSCKSKAIVLTAGSAKDILTSDAIVKKHYENKKDFTTLYIKSAAHYEDANQSQNVTAEIKIKKNEMILISVRILGITMAKALITPKQVKYYEKINGNYFEGDYSLLSRWLGTDLDYNKVQNMLIGQALDDLHTRTFSTSIEDTLYKLQDNGESGTSKSYYFESGKFLVKKQEVTQHERERSVQIAYPNYANYNQLALPTNIIIDALQPKGKVNITIDYNTVSIDEDLSFPYSVPEGYERIFIN